MRFAQIFMRFAQIFMRFAQIFMRFAQLSTGSRTTPIYSRGRGGPVDFGA